MPIMTLTFKIQDISILYYVMKINSVAFDLQFLTYFCL